MTADLAKKSRSLFPGAGCSCGLGMQTKRFFTSAFLGCILVSLGLCGCSSDPYATELRERLFWEVFVGWGVLAAFLTILCVAAVLGGPLWGKAVRRMGWIGTPLLIVMLGTVSCYAGYKLFGVDSLGHDMLDWGTLDYVNEMVRSLSWSFLLSAITLLPWRPWKLFQMGSKLRAAALLLAVLLINYLLGALVYMKFASVGME
jgi:hypothetical protein